jgi:hypothetical protein
MRKSINNLFYVIFPLIECGLTSLQKLTQTKASISKVSSFLDVIERKVLQTSIHWHLVTIVHFQIPKDMTLILSIG